MEQTVEAVWSRPELRRFFGDWFCGCGSPEDAAGALLKLLRLHPGYEHQRELDEWLPDAGVRYLLLYQLDRAELTEHGGSVGGAWLTDRGKALRAGLEQEGTDDFEALFEQHCIHGYDVGDGEHNCVGSTEPDTSP
jgi:hypothetical protein